MSVMVMSNFLNITNIIDSSWRKRSRSQSGTDGSKGSSKAAVSCSSARIASASRAEMPAIARRNVCLFVSRFVAQSTVMWGPSCGGRLLPGHHAAVGDDGLTGDETACVGDQEQCGTDHFGWIGESLHECRGLHGVDEFRRIAAHHVGVHRSGGQGVDADSL